MRIGASLSATDVGHLAAAEAADAAAQSLGGRPCRLAVVFASASHAGGLAAIGAAVDARLRPEAMIGGVAQGVVGPGIELEGEEPGVAVWAAAFDGGEVRPFRSWATPASSGGMAVVGWPDTRPRDVTLLLADPHSYPVSQVIDRIGDTRPGHVIAGGMLTAGEGSGGLLLRTPAEATDVEVHDDGAVGVVLRDVAVRTAVSQGCRPVGEPFVVTGAERNVITELGGDPAAEQLQRIFAEVDESDRALMQRGLHVGLVTDEYRDSFGTGDFLIRSVMGADTETGAVAIGDVAEVGQTVQFQVRDAASADADLHTTLARQPAAATGALLFTCNGRGRRFFGEPHHDVSVVGDHLTDRVAGAFCAGEIGPVAERSHLHGFTASLVIFGEDG